MSRVPLILALLLAIGGCANFDYYLQSIRGQSEIVEARRPISEVLSQPQASPELKQKLALVQTLREFASHDLGLPDNASFRSYADLKRPYVVWNVFATAEFEVEPRQWCFIFAGCVDYRGYFSRTDAETFAASLRAEGDDVFVAGIPAYSTLGWFDDPVLNTFIHYPEYEFARLIFHELAHQIVYVKDDSEFNESFAVAVELEGIRRWLARRNDPALSAAFEQSQQRRTQFEALTQEYRAKLAQIYRLRIAPEAMRAQKGGILAEMRESYSRLKASWDGFTGYDRFFQMPNNAALASVALYTARVPQFQALLDRQHGDLPAFYIDVKRLAKLSKEERNRLLDTGSSSI